MPRRKAASEAELLLPEDQQPRGRKKLVEAEHTIKYSAPVPVAVEEESTEDTLEEGFEFEEEKTRRRKKTSKDERDELKREMDKLGVATVSRLKLSIDKYTHADSEDSGTQADKSFCAKYGVTKDHILNDDYLDTARKFGPGRYWFTLRMDNKILRQWERIIHPAATPIGPIIQNGNPSDPTSPQFVFQMPEGQQQAQAVDPFKEAERALNLVKKYNEAFGGFQPQGAQNGAKTEEEALANALLNRPEVVENVLGSVLKRFGAKGGNDDEPGWSNVVMEAVKNNQIAASIQALGNVALMFLDRFLPQRGNNNGQTQMAPTPLQASGQADNQRIADRRSDFTQEVPQGNQSLQPTNGTVDRESGMLPAATPEDPYVKMLTGVIATLANNGPVDEAVKRVDGFLLIAPQYAQVVENHFSQPAEQLLGAISTIPGCEQIAQAEHAKQWVEQFQAKFFAEGGEEE